MLVEPPNSIKFSQWNARKCVYFTLSILKEEAERQIPDDY